LPGQTAIKFSLFSAPQTPPLPFVVAPPQYVGLIAKNTDTYAYHSMQRLQKSKAEKEENSSQSMDSMINLPNAPPEFGPSFGV
jgi:hypothetical protein